MPTIQRKKPLKVRTRAPDSGIMANIDSFDHVPTAADVQTYYGTKVSSVSELQRIDARCVRFAIVWADRSTENWSDWVEYDGTWSLGAD